MKYNLDQQLVDEIIAVAVQNGVKKVILFGSRARGDNSERSDIDLAISGGNALDFYYDVEEKVHTLLMFDVVELDRGISAELQAEIERDGVILYEEV
ncbi:MAG: nucleotidyltransferase domain-containing protein [Clostridia bacterium]|nr:nucleotidyltransferase domain-containing protein [Clostridia bacterium]